MNDTIDALKFWCSVVADAYGQTDRDTFAERVITGLKASGVKVRSTTYEAICLMHQALMENRKWQDRNGS